MPLFSMDQVETFSRPNEEKQQVYETVHAELVESTPPQHGCLALGSYATFLAERAAGFTSSPLEVISPDDAHMLYQAKIDACTGGQLPALSRNAPPRCGLMPIEHNS